MEQNNLELLEEIEQDIVVEPTEETTLKEYEKLLLAEKNRKDQEKALNLIKFGCFEQKQENTVDFSVLEKITGKKKYKGLYDLYRNDETDELFFICPLVENNKGDEDESLDMKPYAYDVIQLEVMDAETYKLVCKAAKNNINNAVSVMYKSAFICYFINLAVLLFLVIYYLIVYTGQNGLLNVIVAIFQTAVGPYSMIAILGLPLLVLMSIKYKKYKDQ